VTIRLFVKRNTSWSSVT